MEALIIEKDKADAIIEKLDAIVKLLEGKTSKRTMLTTMEAAEYFGVNLATMYRWVRAGRVPAHRPGGSGKIMIDVAEATEAIKTGRTMG